MNQIMKWHTHHRFGGVDVYLVGPEAPAYQGASVERPVFASNIDVRYYEAAPKEQMEMLV